jgi:hypothetical protein
MRTKLRYIPYYGSLVLLVYMPFHVFLSQWLSTFTGGLDIWKGAKDLITFLLVPISVLAVKLYAKKPPTAYWYFLAVATGYGLLHGLTYYANKQTNFSVAALATAYNCRLFGYLVIGWSAALVTPDKVQPRKLAKLLIVVSTVVCLFGLVQFMFPQNLMTHFGYSVGRGVKPNFYIDNKPELVRVMSTVREPNSLGAYLIVPILLIVAGINRTKRDKTLLYGLLALHGLILGLTYSRSALLGLFTSLAAYFLYTHRAKVWTLCRKYAVVIVVGTVLLAGGAIMLRDQYFVQNVIFHSDENTVATADSNDNHLAFAKRGVQAIIKRPFGYGPGTAGPVSMQNPDGGFVPENYFLQLGYELGVLGLLLFLAVCAWLAKRLLKAPSTFTRILLASFVGITLINLLLHAWANETVAAQWWLLAGLALRPALRNSHNKVKKTKLV